MVTETQLEIIGLRKKLSRLLTEAGMVLNELASLASRIERERALLAQQEVEE